MDYDFDPDLEPEAEDCGAFEVPAEFFYCEDPIVGIEDEIDGKEMPQ